MTTTHTSPIQPAACAYGRLDVVMYLKESAGVNIHALGAAAAASGLCGDAAPRRRDGARGLRSSERGRMEGERTAARDTLRGTGDSTRDGGDSCCVMHRAWGVTQTTTDAAASPQGRESEQRLHGVDGVWRHVECRLPTLRAALHPGIFATHVHDH